jgi:peroxiredoxin
MFRTLMSLGLAAVLSSSLVCSTAIRHGHADVPIAATAEQIQPLGVGDEAPWFTVRTVGDEPFVLDPQALQRPAILITFRGGWCPFCNMHLSELKDAIPQISDLDVDVLFLSGDRPELLYASLERETAESIADLGYTILSDADAQAAMALGIAFRASDRTIERRHEKGQDIEKSSMDRHGVLPVPAVFVVGRDGMISYTYVNPDYKIRLPADDLLAAARSIAAAD